MNEQLRRLRDEFYKIVDLQHLSSEFAHFYDVPQHDGSCHVEYKNGKYRFIASDRGELTLVGDTMSMEECLYWLISDVTWQMALIYELNHRDRLADFDSKYDSRRVVFGKHIDLLKGIDQAWAEAERKRYNEILQNNPFRDGKEPKLL